MKMFTTADGKSHIVTFLLVCGIFCLSGLCNGMIDVFNRHFKDSLHLSDAQSALVQGAWYGAYFQAERAVRNLADKYVMSYKPNPAVFAYDTWHPDQARQELRELLERGRGCHVELIMKDISTVRYDPKRLWEWSEIAMETALEP